MSFAVVQNGAVRQILQMDMPFTVGDKTYSSKFLRTSTPEEKLQAGVWEIIEGARADDRFYWVSPASHRVNEVNSTVEATYAATAKELNDREESDEQGNPLYVQVYDATANNGQGGMVNTAQRLITKGLKSQWVAATKDTANKLMSASDWMVIRKVERNVDIPAATATYRAAVIAECTRLVTAINAAADVPALVAALNAQAWPEAE
jgi:hypothetical protein